MNTGPVGQFLGTYRTFTRVTVVGPRDVGLCRARPSDRGERDHDHLAHRRWSSWCSSSWPPGRASRKRTVHGVNRPDAVTASVVVARVPRQLHGRRGPGRDHADLDVRCEALRMRGELASRLVEQVLPEPSPCRVARTSRSGSVRRLRRRARQAADAASSGSMWWPRSEGPQPPTGSRATSGGPAMLAHLREQRRVACEVRRSLPAHDEPDRVAADPPAGPSCVGMHRRDHRDGRVADLHDVAGRHLDGLEVVPAQEAAAATGEQHRRTRLEQRHGWQVEVVHVQVGDHDRIHLAA